MWAPLQWLDGRYLIHDTQQKELHYYENEIRYLLEINEEE